MELVGTIAMWALVVAFFIVGAAALYDFAVKKIEDALPAFACWCILLLIFLAIIGYAPRESRITAGIIIAKSHADASTSVGYVASGDVAVVSSPEKFTVTIEGVRNDTGAEGVRTIELPASVWAKLEVGDGLCVVPE